MKNLMLIFFFSLFFISCNSDEEIFPRTEYYAGTSHLKEYLLEVFMIDSMYHFQETSIDTMFQDTIELVFEKVDDEIQLQITYENIEFTRVLDCSGNFYSFNAYKPVVDRIINFQGEDKLHFKNYYTSPSPDQGGSYNNKNYFNFEGIKL